MPLPLPNLDDRRFDDLVAELRARLASHVPEWELAPGDPGWALIDVLAWLAETILYRANLIPERQRRAFLDLLGLPLRAAAPARGVVCIDSAPNAPQPV
ncbi:MAG TPA: putative baseplate assembly protein, partial [Plasticicumulans sp.]|nr:putative baseplate assembly protein [Plasticicumulans sp.]